MWCRDILCNERSDFVYFFYLFLSSFFHHSLSWPIVYWCLDLRFPADGYVKADVLQENIIIADCRFKSSLQLYVPNRFTVECWVICQSA